MNSKIYLLDKNLPVSEIYWALRKHPEFWNRHTLRTAHPDSPHHELDDIWVRFGDPKTADAAVPHDAVWYEGIDVLGVKPLIMRVFAASGGTKLGGVLITRIPPGKRCKPHIDPGWHATHYEKYAVQIASAPGQAFHVEDEVLETQPGDLFWFNNQHLHWVENPTPYERVTMVICIRKEY